MVEQAQKLHGATFEFNSVFGLEKVDRWNSIRTSARPDLAQCNFWVFPTMEREFRGKKFRSDQQYAARFREVGGVL
jgi:hypothetical protein